MNIEIGFLAKLLGIATNSITLAIFMRKKFETFSARNIFISLILADTFKLIIMIILYNFALVTRFMSELACRLISYFEAFTTALPMFLVTFASIDRFFYIKYPNFKFNRNLIILLIISFALIYSSTFAILPDEPKAFSLNRTNTNNSSLEQNYTFYCSAPLAFFLTETLVSQIIPILITFLFSCLLIHTIFKSRLKLLRLTSRQDRRKLLRDIKFAISTLIINISYVLLNLPLFIYFILNKINSKQNYFESLKNLIYLLNVFSYGLNFYILIISNLIFRQEFLVMFCRTKTAEPSTTN